MNRILLRALIVAILFWIALQFYSPGDSHTLDRLLYVVIMLTNLAVLIHMFWDRRLRLWGAGSVAIMFGAAGWAVLFGWFLYRSTNQIDPGVSEGWLDIVRALIVISGPLLIYALIRFRVDKHDQGYPAHPGEMLTEGLTERRTVTRRAADRERMNRISDLEARIAEYEGR